MDGWIWSTDWWLEWCEWVVHVFVFVFLCPLQDNYHGPGALSLTQSEGWLWFNKRAGKTNAHKHTHTSKHTARHIQSTCGTEQALFWACLFTWECFLTFHVVVIVWSGTSTKTGVSRGSKERDGNRSVREIDVYSVILMNGKAII